MENMELNKMITDEKRLDELLEKLNNPGTYNAFKRPGMEQALTDEENDFILYELMEKDDIKAMGNNRYRLRDCKNDSGLVKMLKSSELKKRGLI